MGAFLDSAEDIRQDKENTSRQAHKTKAKLEKDKDKGVKMINTKTITPETGTTSIGGHEEIELSYKVGEAWKVVRCEVSHKPKIGVPDLLEVIVNVTSNVPAIERAAANDAIIDYHRRTYYSTGLTVNFPQ